MPEHFPDQAVQPPGVLTASADEVRPCAKPGAAFESLAGQNDRRILCVLACFFAFFYAYFFQGGGWAQNTEFDSIRAIVENGTINISAFAANTGDAGEYRGRIYSNKPPGLAFVGAPFYWIAYHAERLTGVNPDSRATMTFNAHLLTFILSGIPGVVLLLFLFRHFRRRSASRYEAFFLAAAFGLGSLALPFSGVMMNHLLTACLLFAAWHMITGAELQVTSARVAGFMAGFAVLTDSLAAPAVCLLVLHVAAQRRRFVMTFLTGAVPAGLILLEYNYLCFGNILVSNHSIEAESFKTPGYLLGVFYWPQPIKLWWLTMHPFRGLFYCCPLFMISLLSLRGTWPIRKFSPEAAVSLLIVGYHLLFNLCFNGWTGGWGVGPRYLIPALPFLYSFALTGYRAFPLPSALLAGISAVFMAAVTAVEAMVPSPNTGPPPESIPVLDCLRLLFSGKVAVSTQGIMDYLPRHSNPYKWASYNLGELIGLPGVWSLVPAGIALLFLVRFGYGLHLAERRPEISRA